MLEISGLLPCFSYLNVTTVGHLSRIIMAMLATIGGGTMTWSTAHAPECYDTNFLPDRPAWYYNGN
jgi:hypothetical protein